MKISFRSIAALCAIVLVGAPFNLVRAEAAPKTAAIAGDTATAAELEKAISDHNSQIEALNKEIEEYQKQLDTTSSKKQTLQGKIKQLDTSRKKVSASINLTKNQIGKTELEIKQLGGEISNKQETIAKDKSGLGESIRILHSSEQQPLVMQVLGSEDLPTAWRDTEAMVRLQSAINERIDKLAKDAQSLNESKVAAEAKNKQLSKQKSTLLSQQGSLDATRQAQAELLTVTKAQESNFQSILSQKKAAKAAFDSALADLKSQLQYSIDPNTVPVAGKGVLSWPLDKVVVTQYFGNTAFAAAGAYSGKGHNGIDLGASVGTPLKAALSGTVIGTGNTDSVKGCYSFGKWVLIKHRNGLATLYAHMSKITVSNGEQVDTGDMIGYSGETGYATGPHLHFGVYVASATKIMKLGDATNKKTPCSGAVMPIAPLSAYLNPMSYL